MKSSGSNGSSKVDRKTVEKNRRVHMKTLCLKLSSLIPKEYKNSKDILSQHDHLDQAAAYVTNLKARIEKLKQRKGYTIICEGSDNEVDTSGFGPPAVEVRYRDSILEVVLIAAPLKKEFMFYRAIRVLVEEGAEVMNASFSIINNKILYTIHSKVSSSMMVLDVSRVSKRLKALIQFETNFDYGSNSGTFISS